jgi:hypothetical protein
MLFIPGTFCMLFQERTKNSFALIIISIVVLFLIVGNVYQIPESYINHSNKAEYMGTFKNWVKPQEFNSVTWMISHDFDRSNIIADEVIWRLYNMNSPDFNGYWWSGNFSIGAMPVDFNMLHTMNGYLFIRQENFYRIINLGSWTPKKDYRLEQNEYNNLTNFGDYKSIYDDGEIHIFSSY